MGFVKKRGLLWVVLILVVLGVCGGLLWRYYLQQQQAAAVEAQLPEKYPVQEAVQQGMQALERDHQPVQLVQTAQDQRYKAQILVSGWPEAATAKAMLDLLEARKMEAVFFMPAMQVAEDDTTARLLAQRQQVGSMGLNGTGKLETLSSEALIEELSLAQSIFQQELDGEAKRLLCNTPEEATELLRIVGAAGFQEVYDSPNVINHRSFQNQAQMQAYVDSLPNHTLIQFKLGALSEEEYNSQPEEDEIQDSHLVDPDQVDATSKPQEQLSEQQQILRAFGWLLEALNDTNYQEAYEEARTANAGQEATPVRAIHTTQRAVIYQFTGVSEGAEMEAVLSALEQTDNQGTFFATLNELEQFPELIQRLLTQGHEVGIAVRPSSNNFDYYLAYHQLLEAKTLLMERDGYTPKLVSQLWGEASAELAEAVSAMGLTLAGYDYGMFQESLKGITDGTELVRTVLGKIQALQRGQSLWFPLGYYEQPNTVAQAIYGLNPSRTQYPARPFSEVWWNDAYRYTYPLPEEKILFEVKDRIYWGQLGKHGDLMQLTRNRYIGDPDSIGSKLPGFSPAEQAQIYTGGKIRNSRNTVFLTFDDWGTDMTIDNLLYVLRKHKVQATFFVRSNQVEANPNLLRAIAMEGHDIASHTHDHMVLANTTGDPNVYTDLTGAQYDELRRNMALSYRTMQGIVGDIMFRGKPALTTLFRPPTLAVSRKGMQAAFDSGFTYVVSGDFTTHDYEAKNTAELVDKLEHGIRSASDPTGPALRSISSGSIVVMHMSDNSYYTSFALDTFLTRNAYKADGDPTKYTFAKLSTYLDGTYSNS